MYREEGLSRRVVVAASIAGVTALSGCLTDALGESGPSQQTYELTISRSGSSLAATITPAGDVADVIQVGVGDDVTFQYRNTAEGPISVHNHVTDEEAVIEPGDTHSESFTPTEEIVGRHEIEGSISESGHHEETTATGHQDEQTTTDHHGETTTDHHGETTTDHHGETTTDHHGETTTTEHHTDATATAEGGHGESASVVAVVEVRP